MRRQNKGTKCELALCHRHFLVAYCFTLSHGVSPRDRNLFCFANPPYTLCDDASPSLPAINLAAHQRDRLLVDAGGVPSLDSGEIRLARLVAGARLPAMGAQEVGGGAQRISRVLEIAGAIRQDSLRHELRLPDLAMHGAALGRR